MRRIAPKGHRHLAVPVPWGCLRGSRVVALPPLFVVQSSFHLLFKAAPFSTHSTNRIRHKGSLRHVLTRSMLACGCASLRLPGAPLHRFRPVQIMRRGGSEEQMKLNDKQRRKS